MNSSGRFISLLSEEYTLVELDEISKRIAAFVSAYDVNTITLEGDLGAGKTTLLKQLLWELKVVDDVTSPSFSLVNQYSASDGKTVYHLDLYRLMNIEEAFDAGILDLLDSMELCFIEWPSIIEDYLVEYIRVVLVDLGSDRRQITIDLIRN